MTKIQRPLRHANTEAAPPMSWPTRRCLAVVGCALLLAACDGSGNHGKAGTGSVAFPADAEITQALKADFEQDANNAKAQELVRTLGGEGGALEYRIKRVIYRQGAFETHYDVDLRMGQAGEQSLKSLYLAMIPKEQAAKLPEQSQAEARKWLLGNADSQQAANPQQAAALRASVEALDKCYGAAKPKDAVVLMEGLAALVSPAREGWFAEKMQSAGASLRCLPL